MCQWAGLKAEVEIFNLFAASIPQEALRRMERGRKVQSIVPTCGFPLALTTSFLSLSVVGVRAKTRLLLGRLEVIGLRATAVKLH